MTPPSCSSCGATLKCPICNATIDYEVRGNLHVVKCSSERCQSDAAHNGGSGSSALEAFRNMLAGILSELKAGNRETK